jgi:hypothetical protein
MGVHVDLAYPSRHGRFLVPALPDRAAALAAVAPGRVVRGRCFCTEHGSADGRCYPRVGAASTLAAAALFNPLRRRVQQMVDRRFNRARYDADQTVAAFAARLKDTVDLHSVQDDLANVVGHALEPVHVSVWISQVRVLPVSDPGKAPSAG